MPNYGEEQMPAGYAIDTSSRCGCIGPRKMQSRDVTIVNDLEIGKVTYKGNPALNANR